MCARGPTQGRRKSLPKDRGVKAKLRGLFTWKRAGRAATRRGDTSPSTSRGSNSSPEAASREQSAQSRPGGSAVSGLWVQTGAHIGPVGGRTGVGLSPDEDASASQSASPPARRLYAAVSDLTGLASPGLQFTADRQDSAAEAAPGSRVTFAADRERNRNRVSFTKDRREPPRETRDEASSDGGCWSEDASGRRCGQAGAGTGSDDSTGGDSGRYRSREGSQDDLISGVTHAAGTPAPFPIRAVWLPVLVRPCLQCRVCHHELRRGSSGSRKAGAATISC